MRYTCLLLLLLASGPALAQAPPAVARPDTVTAAPDTAAAIHRLFAAKRRKCWYVIGSTALVAGTAIALVEAAPGEGGGGGGGAYGFSLSDGGNDKVYKIFSINLIAVPALLIEAAARFSWRRRNERKMLEAWQQHRLPAYYKRRLKPKYF